VHVWKRAAVAFWRKGDKRARHDALSANGCVVSAEFDVSGCLAGRSPRTDAARPELTQIERYADAVARDPRFDKVSVRWNFWLVGTKMNEFVAGRASQPHLPPGVVSQPLDGRVTIHVKTWSQILDDCEQRLKSVREKLDYRSARDAGVEYLRQRHEKYLPGVLRAASKNP